MIFITETPAKPSMQSPAQGDIRARSTTVKWTQPSLGSDEAPIASFKLHYLNTTFSSIEHIPSSVAGSKLLTNLKPYTNYNVKVMATSILGDGPWSGIKPFKTSTAGKHVGCVPFSFSVFLFYFFFFAVLYPLKNSS